ncbi:hypothetical protein GIB67_016669 [Kingdonia uniflora]|uniref:Uncharacterized protein n=1 Tax=Kingdonia uniflora TaxID=39325 RepID=A0A7J7MEG0_9MAGN|nr:hypothetical protein GIB67_016669 [Kingdonia uniflora]
MQQQAYPRNNSSNLHFRCPCSLNHLFIEPTIIYDSTIIHKSCPIQPHFMKNQMTKLNSLEHEVGVIQRGELIAHIGLAEHGP